METQLNTGPTSQEDSGQLGALEKLAQRKGKMQAAQQLSHAPDVALLVMRSYLEERSKRLLYADKDLHVLASSSATVCAHMSFAPLA